MKALIFVLTVIVSVALIALIAAGVTVNVSDVTSSVQGMDRGVLAVICGAGLFLGLAVIDSNKGY